MVVERMRTCDNITALAKELGLQRKLIYIWRAQLDPESNSTRKSGPATESREVQLEKEVGRLKRALADKTLELDFFKGALQKVAARRRQRKTSGDKTSTSTSGK